MVTTVQKGNSLHNNNPFAPRVGGDTPTNNKDTLEQNRVDLLRILLNGKVKCSHCGHEFRSGTMDKLSFTEWTMTHTPEKLMVTLYCGPCGHEGPYNMKPNPFMEDPEKIDAYETLVSMQRKMQDKFPHSPPIVGEGQGWNEDENEEEEV